MRETDQKEPADLAQNLWKEQAMTSQTFTQEYLAKRAARFARRISCRNMIEYAAAVAVVVVSFGAAAMEALAGIETLADAIIITGFVILGLGTLIVIWQLHARASSPLGIGGGEASFQSFRAELVRQRDALRMVWLWYLAPFVPGLLLIYSADLFRPEPDYLLTFTLLAGTLVLLGVLFWLNRAAARGIDAEIKALDADLER